MTAIAPTEREAFRFRFPNSALTRGTFCALFEIQNRNGWCRLMAKRAGTMGMLFTLKLHRFGAISRNAPRPPSVGVYKVFRITLLNVPNISTQFAQAISQRSRLIVLHILDKIVIIPVMLPISFKMLRTIRSERCEIACATGAAMFPACERMILDSFCTRTDVCRVTLR